MTTPRILIIDDAQIMRILLKEILIQELNIDKDDIYEAKSGRLGVAKYKQVQPNYIFCDIYMPDIDGVEVVKQIVSLGLEPAPYIIMLTSSREKRLVIQCIKAGADDYIGKPPSVERVAKTLNIKYPILKDKGTHKGYVVSDDIDITYNAKKKVEDELEEIEKMKDLQKDNPDIDKNLEALKPLTEKYISEKEDKKEEKEGEKEKKEGKEGDKKVGKKEQKKD